jgi:hypothetical protein
MRTVIGWAVVIAAMLLIVGLIGWARGPEHHHGNDVGAVVDRTALRAPMT